jgi:hypothetical protein
MNVCARVLGIVGVFAAAATLSGVATPPVGASLPRPIAATPTAASSETTRAVGYLVLDDRDLARRTPGWSSVASLTAFRSTVTCSSGRGETLRVPDRAKAGGDVRVWTGPGRGSVAVLVGGRVVARASTASSTFGYRRIPFAGAGRVDIRITSADKRVCIDAVRVVLPDIIPGG